MANLTPVQGNPFEGQPRLTKVEGNPFQPEQKSVRERASEVLGSMPFVGAKVASQVLRDPKGSAEFVAGIPGAAPTIASSVIAEPVAGLAGLGAAAIPGLSGAETVEKTRDLLTIDPIGDRAEQTLSKVGEALEPIADIPGKAGGLAEKAGASPIVSTAIETGVAAIPELLGLKVGGVARRAGRYGQNAEPGYEPPPPKLSAKERQIKEQIESGSTENSLGKYNITKKGKVVKDRAFLEASKQGFDEGVLTSIKQSSKVDKVRMRRMLNVLEKGHKDARFGAEFRTSDVIGESIVSQYTAVEKANRTAGQNLNGVAKKLKGEEVDFSSTTDSFISDLDEMGVSIGDDLKPNFKGSDIEGIAGAEQALSRLIKRMTSPRKIDAFEGHRLKKFIDESVSFGKKTEGLSGKAERVMKRLRRNIDQTLDENFPDYKKVNDDFATSRSALDSFESVAGRKFDPSSDNADKFAGVLSRRISSNTQSRAALMDSLKELQEAAKKTGAKRNEEDAITQVMFANELERMFGQNAKTSIGGILESTGEKFARGDRSSLIIDAAKAGSKKVRGVNDANAIKAIRAILGD